MILLLPACSVQNTEPGEASEGNESVSEWLIPESEVFSAQGQDGIPSVDSPKFSPVQDIHFVQDDRDVLGVKIGDEIRAYPIQVLDWHEVINDRFDEMNVAVTFCPLTGSGIAWDRGQAEYGVSGLLFRNNLIAYDRSSGSRWSQMQMRAVYGPARGSGVDEIQVIRSSWNAWKQMFPESVVLNTDTGYDRNYTSIAYPGTQTKNGSAALFPVKNRDQRLKPNEEVHGIIAGITAEEGVQSRVYVVDQFPDTVNVIQETIGSTPVVIAGAAESGLVVSFSSILNGERKAFTAIQGELPVIMQDESGNRFNIFGEVTSGPDLGSRLQATKSYNAFWYAWADFFPEPEIYTFHQ